MTIIASSMVFMDGTLVNVALPIIQSELNASTTDVQWIVESYALLLAALMLIGGSLGDRYGHRKIFGLGIVVFALASSACGLATTASQLIIARAIQGVGGALLVPGSLAIISTSFAGAQRGRAIGTWSGSTAMTTALGPVLGGWLVENVSWRWAFLINIPLAVFVLLILYWRVPETRNDTPTRLDPWGALLATFGLGTSVYGLIESATLGLQHPTVLVALGLGIITLAAFLYSQTQLPSPMLPLHLFQSRTFSGANLLTLLLYAALGGSLFYLPFNLIQVQGYSTTEAGAAYLPFILTMFILSRWAGGLVSRYGARWPLVIGSVIAAMGYTLLALPGIGDSYWATFFPGLAILGLGMTICIAPLTTTVMGAVAQQQAGLASGINNAISRTAALIAIAVFGIFITQAFNSHLDTHLLRLDLTTDTRHFLETQRAKLAGAELPQGLATELAQQLRRAIAESYVAGYRFVMFVAAGLALAGGLSAWYTIDGSTYRSKTAK